jgi:polysaccharide export outer membrane protein
LAIVFDRVSSTICYHACSPNVSRSPSRIALCLLALASACGPAATRTLNRPRPPVFDASLGPGDLFDVRVFGETDLTGQYRVGPDGTIDYPLVGRLEVTGLLPSQLSTLLRDKLARFVHAPQVSVLLREMNSKRVIVYGQVQRPGTFPYTDAMTIVQVISLAGGFTAMAARERVVLSHNEKDQQKIVEVNVREIADGHAPNRFVAPGDEVYVPERIF